jgi:hypothetical protein
MAVDKPNGSEHRAGLRVDQELAPIESVSHLPRRNRQHDQRQRLQQPDKTEDQRISGLAV